MRTSEYRRGHNTSCTDSVLLKSKRDWNNERFERQTRAEELPLVSRSNWGWEGERQSLKNIALQRTLWDHILQKVECLGLSDPKEAWEPIVDLLRKLREGVYASRWSQGEWEFAVKVYELAVLCCLKAQNEDELSKSFRGLVEELYVLQPDLENSYYAALYTIYLSFRDTLATKDRMTRLKRDTDESQFAQHVVCSVLANNPIKFFTLYRHAPDSYFRLVMDKHSERMRRHAVQVMRVAYYSMSLDWAGRWMGLPTENIPAVMERLIQPGSIRIDPDQQMVHFPRTKK
ncbi:hypothetical protein DFQ29_009616 [Apophysomyces sp. BC1021]|nr:hypothetical protein DFQ29_009616 [Apophysomyces sp. BC1021]